MRIARVFVTKYPKGKMLGFADVFFSLDDSTSSHMTWKGFKLFQSDDGSIQIQLPSKKDERGKVDEQSGKPIYYPVISIQRAKKIIVGF